MKSNIWITIFAIIMSLSIILPARAELTDLSREFSDALITNDIKKMNYIVMANNSEIPGEVESIMKAARISGISEEVKDALFYMGEKMAKLYMDSSGESGLLKDVKRNRFESKLGDLVSVKSKAGIYTIKIPMPDHKGPSYTFKPDNLQIEKGESVVWVNEDSHSHVFASMAVIGDGGIFAPSIEPGGSWKYQFKRSGEYFYICFIHKGMIGKITVK